MFIVELLKIEEGNVGKRCWRIGYSEWCYAEGEEHRIFVVRGIGKCVGVEGK